MHRIVKDIELLFIEAHAAGMRQPFQVTIRGHMFEEDTPPLPARVDTLGGPIDVTFEATE